MNIGNFMARIFHNTWYRIRRPIYACVGGQHYGGRTPDGQSLGVGGGEPTTVRRLVRGFPTHDLRSSMSSSESFSDKKKLYSMRAQIRNKFIFKLALTLMIMLLSLAGT